MKQPRLTVAYFGKPGSFSHEVAARRFPQGAELTPRRTISEVFEAVATGEAVHGVVPIENMIDESALLNLDKRLRQLL